ncbi:FtsW/RodA/SpoVE family cell cycle protein [Salipaludibacillus daqingensis]|uniref:FtsW/RodA/SpoVE family cell cycle protein n=1 Tax=Salipaludibacillus daqingensis TaxID=3041001 RepID=UPI002474BDA7|nr:FtsW/RodA/SpoVE family cell cycle protein [Salipaludibacillus daqingensis]
MSPSRFEEFLSKVTSKVKSKEAHGMIKKELTHHLQELSQSFEKRASSKAEAEEKAIQEMGNPYTIGEKLNQLHKPKIDWLLLALFLTIASISFLPLINGVPELSLSSAYFISRQAIWYTLAILVILGLLFFDYRRWKNFWLPFYGIGISLLLCTLLFGREMNGAKRFVSFGDFSFDATVFSLFFLFIAWTGLLTKINTFNSWSKQCLLCFLFWTPIFLYFMLPHFSLTIIYFFSIMTIFTFSHVSKKLAMKVVIANATVTASILFTFAMISFSRGGYFFHRLAAFINPTADPNGDGYIYILVKDVLSQAGWFGNGIFNDLSIHSLPEAHTDFAFPYLVYSLGWVFGIFLCLILLLFVLRISSNAFKTKDLYGRLLVIGGATFIAVPAFWNILMGLGIVPIMGVSLPFISYGGSMLLFYAAILGLVLNVYRRKDIIEPTIVKVK